MLNRFSLQIQNISHSYGDKNILTNINWTMVSGEIYVLLGPNGAGKTTFLNLLGQIIQPTSGNINLVDLKNQNINTSLVTKLGYMTEFSYFYPFLTPIEMIRLVGKLKGLESNFLENKINYWIKRLELWEYQHQKIESLSQGTQKRIAFICSIIHEPKIILLDEPTNGLDPEQIIIFRDTLKELSMSGSLILLSTHIMDLAEKLADNIGIIRNTNLVYTGKSTQNLEDLYLKTQ
ncbi:ABC transporter ATP-binding protein [Bacillus toyonensis]|uniref:ABC transporter ATP-binding protein n=1 Tax=Bacillus toyonensis TaxID=155322 RepID=UPI003D1D4C1C